MCRQLDSAVASFHHCGDVVRVGQLKHLAKVLRPKPACRGCFEALKQTQREPSALTLVPPRAGRSPRKALRRATSPGRRRARSCASQGARARDDCRQRLRSTVPESCLSGGAAVFRVHRSQEELRRLSVQFSTNISVPVFEAAHGPNRGGAFRPALAAEPTW